MEFQSAGYFVAEAKKRFSGKFPKWIATNWGSDIYLFGQLKAHEKKIKEVIGENIYGAGNDIMADSIREAINKKGSKKPTIISKFL